MSKYEIVIEFIQNNGGPIDIAEEIKPPKKKHVPNLEKSIAPWVMQERRAIRDFLMFIVTFRGLKEVKKMVSRATYYRHLKYCEEKGYIKNGKLTKKIFLRN